MGLFNVILANEESIERIVNFDVDLNAYVKKKLLADYYRKDSQLDAGITRIINLLDLSSPKDPTSKQCVVRRELRLIKKI